MSFPVRDAKLCLQAAPVGIIAISTYVWAFCVPSDVLGGNMSLLDFWETQSSSMKRRKVADNEPSSRKEEGRILRESENDSSASPIIRTLDSTARGEIPVDDEPQIPASQTELESSLPAIEPDNQAINEYEISHAVREDDEEPDLQQRLQDGNWRKGKSSIYVDAFNLALQTVLDEEAHLFNEAEMEVFRQWKELSYESQYLYV